jgi:hypothetical protein
MPRFVLVMCSLVVAAFVLGVSGSASAEQFSAAFSGFQELGALNNETGAILSNGQGTLQLTPDKQSDVVTYNLTYSSLTSNVTQAHIHFGKRHVPGGIFVFLCTNLGNGPAGTPSCPPAGGTVTGSITPASILAVPGQNVTAGDFGALEAILESNSAYGNIHTVRFPAGEIRGQVRKGGGDAHKD